jgi:hypothetical protein
MSKVKKRCIPCDHKLECLGTNVCIWDKKRIGQLQKILDRIGNDRWMRMRRGLKQVSLRELNAYHKFDREFKGSRNVRRGEAILFMKKYSKQVQRWHLNQKRTAFICDTGSYNG